MQELFSFTPNESPLAGYSTRVRKSDEKLKRPPMAQRLIELRQSAGLTQVQLAEQIGVHYSNIGFWELSGTPPRGEVLPKMAHALGVTVDELLGVAPAKTKKPAAKGRLQMVFEQVAKLPRRQQQKVIEMAEGFLALHASGHS